MVRPLRIEYPGAVYHVTSRGNSRSSIFHTDQDRPEFLSIVNSVVKRFNWILHAYCLMDNHYHLLLETPDGNLSRGMRHLNGVYTQKYNWLHHKTGHVFQGRYKAILVDKESYMLELCRYVVLNPVRAKAVNKPGEWKWSSYLYTAGMKKSPEFLTTDWILGLFGKNKTKAQQLYRKFVKEGMEISSPWDDLQGQILLGKENFVGKFSEMLYDKLEIKEIPREQRFLNRPKLTTLFPKEQGKDKRNDKIYIAHIKYGYRLREIADYLGIHYTTVSKVVKNAEG